MRAALLLLPLAAGLRLPGPTLGRRAVAASLAAAVASPLRAAHAEGVKKTASGLAYIEVDPGTGAKPLAGQTISCHYTGWLDGFGDGFQPGDSDKKFDSSYDRRKPLSFAVGTGRVIKGWDEALLDMQVGAKRRLIIPPELGYGQKGAGGIIPPGATLYFDVELLKIL